ncbi:MAG: TetR/AcrR family transcriptional regulator [Arcobacter sp.]|uniref:TetR/AcrR family transcriptional regulator n=1 Tax=Arcobacter sp. TaxID=1872629 RepID=UPI003AFFB52B
MQDIRTRLIEATFQEVFSNGFKGASQANILKKADTKKGSMYHYFPSKKDMVICMIEEKIGKRIEKKWEDLLSCEDNIIDNFIFILIDPNSWDLKDGCPLGNLLQESLDYDEDFAKTLNTILENWKKQFSNILNKAIENKELNPDIEIEKVATFLIASIEGALLIAKKSEDIKDFENTINQLVFYINSLRK